MDLGGTSKTWLITDDSLPKFLWYKSALIGGIAIHLNMNVSDVFTMIIFTCYFKYIEFLLQLSPSFTSENVYISRGQVGHVKTLMRLC